MKLFIDTASAKEIKEMLAWKIFSGVTTNQKIFLAEAGVKFEDRVKDILDLVKGLPLSIELTNTAGSIDDMINEAQCYAKWGGNVVIKVPMFGDGKGVQVASALRELRIKTNITCLMDAAQVLLACEAGGTYASLFFNRIRDFGADAVKTVIESRKLIDACGFATEIIAGSIRKPEDVVEAATAGAHIVTVTPKVLAQMPLHPKTEETIKEFDKAWIDFKKACPP
jgi:transaldolase